MVLTAMSLFIVGQLDRSAASGFVIGELKGMLLGTSDEVAMTNDAGSADSAKVAEASEPRSGPNLPTGAGRPWISLISKIVPRRDTDVGEWIVQGGTLRNVEQRQVESTRLTIPVQPTGSYVFEFDFVRSENGKDLCALFPVRGRGAMIWIV